MTADLIIDNHGRHTAVATFTDRLYQRDLSKKSKVIFLRQLSSTFLTEQVIFVIGQFCRSKISHVLHESDNWYIDLCLAEHRNSFFSIGECNILWSGNDHHACYRNGLHQRQVNIACTGWHVDHKVIEAAPVNIGHKLPDGA